MPKGYKALTGILALTGSLALLTTGQLNPLAWLPLPVLLYGYLRHLRGGRALGQKIIGTLSVLTVGFFFLDAFAMSADVLLAVADLTILFQAIKGFDLKEEWDNLQVFFMCILQMVIASEFTRGIAFGLVFLVFVILLVSAIVLSHFLKEGAWGKLEIKRPVAAVSALAVFFTAVFFISAPRLAGGIWHRKPVDAIKTVGFEGNVDLGSIGRLKLDPTIVMRIETRIKTPLYLRGATLDRFDGTAWTNPEGRGWPISGGGGRFVINPAGGHAVPMKIYLEPLDTNVLFLPEGAVSLQVPAHMLYRNSSGDFFMPERNGHRLVYTVYSIPGAVFYSDVKKSDLQLPGGMDRLEALASGITNGTDDPLVKAHLIERYLKANYAYSLDPPPPPPGVSPIEDFLFHSKKGYCEHYATGMALLLRAAGVPARIVTGFMTTEFNSLGNYIVVRQKDAHTWVEAFIGGRWMRFDPTPAQWADSAQGGSFASLLFDDLKMKWNRYVVSFSLMDQKLLARRLARLPEIITFGALPGFSAGRAAARKALFAIVITALFMGLFFNSLKRKKKARHGVETAYYLKLRSLSEKLGVRQSPSSTPGEFLKAFHGTGFEREAEEFIRIYQEARFGGEEIEVERLPELYAELREKIHVFQPNSPVSGTKTQ